MKVKELIEMLNKEPPEEEVFVILDGAYDSVKSVQRSSNYLFIRGDK